MSNSYNGTTSVLSSAATQTIGTLWSFSAWFKATTEGESNAGTLISHGPTGTERILWQWNAAAAKKLRLNVDWNVYAKWDMTTGFASFTPWIWVGWTYDGGSTTNDPIVYTLVDSTFSTLTVGSGLTEVVAPVGSLQADNQTFRVGNDAIAGVTWDGLIGEVAFWKRILTAAEMQAVAFNGVNVCPDHFNYLPQDGGTAQNLGSSGTSFTATALSVGENPPTRAAMRKG
jgi:hypothetical protein